jgi:hypothetical protein
MGVDVVTPKSVAKEFVEAGYCDYETYGLFIRSSMTEISSAISIARR